MCAHKVNHALGSTHIDADAHLDDYSRPPGASLKLFSRDLAKRERGSEMSIRGSEKKKWESPWILTGCSPGRTPIISVCLQCHSPTASFSELKDPDCSDILSGGKSSSATARFYRCFFWGGEKSFDESGENVVSYPATALDNDIPPAVANSSRAEDVPEDKCHYQLSVIWSGFQLHHPDGGVC